MTSIRTRIATLLLGCLALAGTAAAANMQELVHETQRMNTDDGQITMVWWLPVQFWEESMKASAAIPDAARRQVVDAMSDYTILVLLRAKAGAGGISDAEPKEELVKKLKVTVNGNELQPLPTDQIAPATTLMLAQMKPAIAANLGPLGQAMQFVVYPGKADGKPLLDATQPGDLSVMFYGKDYHWHLPLGSLLPKKVDKKTGEEFPGNYLYNPYTGEKLGGK